MAKPNKESWQYAERMRITAREQKRQLAEGGRQREIDMIGGAGFSPTTGDSWSWNWDSDSSVTTTIVPASVTPTYISMVSQEKFDIAFAEIVSLQAKLSEANEIIEALAAGLADIDALREENAILRSMLEAKPAPPSVYGDDWIDWKPIRGAICPIDRDIRIEVLLRSYCGSARKNTARAGHYEWAEIGNSSIVAYRII